MAKYAEPVVPFVQARHVGVKQKPTAIVLSLSCTTSDKGSALGIANYHHRADAPLKSYHYILDEADTYRCIPGDVAAYGNPYKAINVLICAQPHEYVPLWEDATASKVMQRAADLVADLMLVYKIPKRNLVGEAQKKWFEHRWRRRGGLIVQTIGTWPFESFIEDVKGLTTIKTM